MARTFARASSQGLRNTSAVVPGPPFTMVSWFNCNNLTNDHALISVCDTGGINIHCLQLAGHVDGDPVSAVSCSNTCFGANTTIGYSVGVWQHACGVWATVNDRRVYLNGGSKGTNATSKTVSGIDKTEIGTRDFWGQAGYIDGSITEAAIYSGILTDTQAALFYYRRYSALLIQPQKLLAYWPLRHGDNADWIGRYPMLPMNTPVDTASPPIVYPERDDPVWGLVLPRYRPRRYWVVLKAPAGNPWYAYAQM